MPSMYSSIDHPKSTYRRQTQTNIHLNHPFLQLFRQFCDMFSTSQPALYRSYMPQTHPNVILVLEFFFVFHICCQCHYHLLAKLLLVNRDRVHLRFCPSHTHFFIIVRLSLILSVVILLSSIFNASFSNILLCCSCPHVDPHTIFRLWCLLYLCNSWRHPFLLFMLMVMHNNNIVVQWLQQLRFSHP